MNVIWTAVVMILVSHKMDFVFRKKKTGFYKLILKIKRKLSGQESMDVSEKLD
jgi:hypothetical protein